VRGRELVYRNAPLPGQPLEAPKKIAGLVLPGSALADLSAPPICEFGAMSFQRLKGPPRAQIVGLSPGKAIAFALPDTANPGSLVGCNATTIAVETNVMDSSGPITGESKPKYVNSHIALCDFEGKCTLPDNNPFRIWPEPHEQTIAMAPSSKGIVGVLSQKAGDRWGLYLATSADGKLYEVPRIIGEGKDPRGQLELGALVGFGTRVLMILSADVMGTSRRGWFVMVSDDGGLNWAPP